MGQIFRRNNYPGRPFFNLTDQTCTVYPHPWRGKDDWWPQNPVLGPSFSLNIRRLTGTNEFGCIAYYRDSVSWPGTTLHDHEAYFY